MYMVAVQEEETGDTAAPVAVVVVKGKRSKRQRLHPAVVVAAIAESSSSVAQPDDDGSWRSGADEAASGCVTEEEEDMVLCLMLLARGERDRRAGPSIMVVAPDAADSTATVGKAGKFRSRRPADGAAGEFVYECKTCSKCFPSFQALGGHRTSHKKPRLAPPLPPTASDEKKRLATTDDKLPPPSPPPAGQSSITDPTVLAIPGTPKQQEADTSTAAATSRSSSSKQPRVHVCSMCGAEFASGQALGGHMRRHRSLVPASDDMDGGSISRREKSLLELDLNMPAPCEDAAAETTTFAFAAVKEGPAASALVD